jgi:dCTP deaminase
MAILTHARLARLLADGGLVITPPPAKISEASVNLTLHPKLLVYRLEDCPGGVLDCAADNPTRELAVKPWPEGLVLWPGEFYLASTVECVWTLGHVGILDGRSSVGRLGCKIHFTAGYVEPGFQGQLTLEVEVAKPLRVYAGMQIGQIRFETVDGPIAPYTGKYLHQEGPVASRLWQEFPGPGGQAGPVERGSDSPRPRVRPRPGGARRVDATGERR